MAANNVLVDLKTRHSVSPPRQFTIEEDREARKSPFIIGVTGGTASGKTTVCQKIMEFLDRSGVESNEKRVVIVSQDSFYCDLDEEQKRDAADNNYNFDHPDAFDNQLMIKTLREMAVGSQVNIPVYDFKTHSRSQTDCKVMYPADVILFEGILVLYSRELREMMQMKIFVDTDSDTRLARRILRDINERGRTLESVIEQYTTFVKTSFEDFTLPTKKYADVIIPRGAENDVAINLIGQHIGDILSGKVTINDRKTLRRRSRHASESSALSRPH